MGLSRISLSRILLLISAPMLAVVLGTNTVLAQQSKTLLGSSCTPAMDQGITEPETGRTYVLDYPCDLRDGEPVTFILNLHGGGSNTNFQHAYFPAWKYKEQYRLVVATPYSPTRRWSEVDDTYLQNIVSSVTTALGRSNVRAFWLAGHSQGGSTSRRIVCTPFFENKVDGFLSLSGGRLGGAAPRSPNAGRPRQLTEPEPAAVATAPTAAAPAASDPDCNFSHIFAIGEHEISSLPDSSTVAQQFNCDARMRKPDVIDTEAGGTHDSGHQNPATKEWGRTPRPGTAQIFDYPNCGGGRVVADVVRMDKGHTEGLEPRIVEELVRMMTTAAGGKISN